MRIKRKKRELPKSIYDINLPEILTDFRAYKGKGGGGEPPPAAPQPVNSEYWSDGNLLGKTTLIGGVQKQESFLSPFQKQQQDLQQQYLPKYQTMLFNPDQSEKDSWKTMAEAAKANQMTAFNDDYAKATAKMIQNLSQSGAFGGHSKGSAQVDYFGNELAKTGAKQLDAINNDYTSNLQNYETNYMNKIGNIINLLNGQAAQQQQTNQSNINNALQGFNSGNNFNLQNYQNQMDNWALRQALNGRKSGMGAGGWVNAGMTAAQLGMMAGL
jgi:hypothetical protein